MNAISNTVAKASLALAMTLTANSAVATPDLSQERFDCLIEPLRVINVGSPVQGVIQSLAVDRSETIDAGQVLAQIESGVEEASLAQANMRARMDGEIKSREADLELALQSKARIDELVEKKMASSQQRDEAHAKVKVARMALQQAKERQTLAEYESRWAAKVLERRTIRSPIAGVVVELQANPGEFVYENPIMQVAQLDPLRIEVILPIELYGAIRRGMVAEVFPEIGGQAETASITVVDRLMDPGSSTFGVRLELPNSSFAIPGGQRCEIAFRTDGAMDDGLALNQSTRPNGP
jgi:RND family efflux transporter MFP subunit